MRPDRCVQRAEWDTQTGATLNDTDARPSIAGAHHKHVTSAPRHITICPAGQAGALAGRDRELQAGKHCASIYEKRRKHCAQVELILVWCLDELQGYRLAE